MPGDSRRDRPWQVTGWWGGKLRREPTDFILLRESWLEPGKPKEIAVVGGGKKKKKWLNRTGPDRPMEGRIPCFNPSLSKDSFTSVKDCGNFEGSKKGADKIHTECLDSEETKAKHEGPFLGKSGGENGEKKKTTWVGKGKRVHPRLQGKRRAPTRETKGGKKKSNSSRFGSQCRWANHR